MEHRNDLIEKLLIYKFDIPGEDVILKEGVAQGWQGNLWQCYLTNALVMDENSFSLSCERRGAERDSLLELAKSDFDIFRQLMKLRTDHEILMDFRHNSKAAESASAKRICDLSKSLADAGSLDEMTELIVGFYEKHGVGLFGKNSSFRVDADGKLQPHEDGSSVNLEDLVGYESQKNQLLDNTYAFVYGVHSNNVLLYGDAGTGKSTSVQAVADQFAPDGLRLIEVYKHQFEHIPQIIAQIKKRNYRYILFLDDLSFEENEIEYKYLKSVMEGGAETTPENVLVYATSNRRHLIRETWNDRSDMQHNGEIHRSDTMEEKLSLAGRFGLQIYYPNPTFDEYLTIVEELAKSRDEFSGYTDEELRKLAKTWQVRHGNRSGRTAQQFINDLLCSTIERKDI